MGAKFTVTLYLKTQIKVCTIVNWEKQHFYYWGYDKKTTTSVMSSRECRAISSEGCGRLDPTTGH